MDVHDLSKVPSIANPFFHLDCILCIVLVHRVTTPHPQLCNNLAIPYCVSNMVPQHICGYKCPFDASNCGQSMFRNFQCCEARWQIPRMTSLTDPLYSTPDAKSSSGQAPEWDSSTSVRITTRADLVSNLNVTRSLSIAINSEASRIVVV